MDNKDKLAIIPNFIVEIAIYCLAIVLYFELKYIGVNIPMWIFHVYGIINLIAFPTSAVILKKAPMDKVKRYMPIANVCTFISTVTSGIAFILLIPTEFCFIIALLLFGKTSLLFYIVFIAGTIILSAIFALYYILQVLKARRQVHKQQGDLDKLMNILKTPELCNEESIRFAEEFHEKQLATAAYERMKCSLCLLYEKSDRPDRALEISLTIKPEFFGAYMPIDSYHCDLINCYLINGKVSEANEVFQENLDELNQLYAVATPGQLHTFAMFYRMTGDIPAARKTLDRIFQNDITEKPILFAVHTENAFCCLAEDNINGAEEAFSQARTLAEFPNEKALLSKLEQAFPATTLNI